MIPKKQTKNFKCAYLYQDGHVEVWHEKTDRQGIKAEWLDIFPAEMVGIDCSFKGRIILHHKADFVFMTRIKAIKVSPSDEKNGSQKTRKMGISVETIHISFEKSPCYDDWVYLTQFPGIISSVFDYQPDVHTNYEDIPDYYWNGMQIRKAA